MIILTFPASLQGQIFPMIPSIKQEDITITVKVKETITPETMELLKQLGVKYLKPV